MVGVVVGVGRWLHPRRIPPPRGVQDPAVKSHRNVSMTTHKQCMHEGTHKWAPRRALSLGPPWRYTAVHGPPLSNGSPLPRPPSAPRGNPQGPLASGGSVAMYRAPLGGLRAHRVSRDLDRSRDAGRLGSRCGCSMSMAKTMWRKPAGITARMVTVRVIGSSRTWGVRVMSAIKMRSCSSFRPGALSLSDAAMREREWEPGCRRITAGQARRPRKHARLPPRSRDRANPP